MSIFCYVSFCSFFCRLLDGHQLAVDIHFGMAILTSGFCLLTVTERVSKAKHLQFMSGVYILAYWLSALLWDLILFFITCCLLLVSIRQCFSRPHFPSVPSGKLLFSNHVLDLTLSINSLCSLS